MAERRIRDGCTYINENGHSLLQLHLSAGLLEHALHLLWTIHPSERGFTCYAAEECERLCRRAKTESGSAPPSSQTAPKQAASVKKNKSAIKCLTIATIQKSKVVSLVVLLSVLCINILGPLFYLAPTDTPSNLERHSFILKDSSLYFLSLL